LTFIQGATSAFDLFQGIGGAGCPNKWLGVFVVPINIVSDGQDEFFEVAEYATP
jgi:hypothetical protein